MSKTKTMSLEADRYERLELVKSNKLFDRTTWFNCYHKGYRQPNYPVPAIRGWNDARSPYDGGVKDDFLMIGATYVDWSRGSLEIY